MSCLFDSMYALLTKHGIHFEDSHILRTKIVAFMRDNPNYELNDQSIQWWIKQVSDDMRTPADQYVNRMAHASVWGGAMEISVMSKIFNIKIQVIGRDNTNHMVDCTHGNPDATFVIHWNGSHFTPRQVIEN